MATSFADLESEAMKLPREERALLAHHLLASVHAEPEIDEARAVEVQRRIASVDAEAPLVRPNRNLCGPAKRLRGSRFHG